MCGFWRCINHALDNNKPVTVFDTLNWGSDFLPHNMPANNSTNNSNKETKK